MIHEILGSWPSILAGFLALSGYILIGNKKALGWIFNLFGNLTLAGVGICMHQWGLLFSIVFAAIAARNFVKWR